MSFFRPNLLDSLLKRPTVYTVAPPALSILAPLIGALLGSRPAPQPLPPPEPSPPQPSHRRLGYEPQPWEQPAPPPRERRRRRRRGGQRNQRRQRQEYLDLLWEMFHATRDYELRTQLIVLIWDLEDKLGR